jgi:hypothetical protein
MNNGDLRTSSLAYLWNRRGPERIRKLLFFTYRFDFRWFHNNVLGYLRKSSVPGAEILVFATRFENAGYAGGSKHYGDLYALDEWARWRLNLCIRYLPANRHLFHNKFILAQYESSVRHALPRIIAGIGSANLTASGWSRNLEVWSWDCGACLSACRSFLNYLAGIPNVGGDALKDWIVGLRRYENQGVLAPWLFKNKTAARTAAFSSLATGIRGTPAVLRVLSPYFDDKSPALLNEMLGILRAKKKKPRRVEIWVDGSGNFTTSPHLQNLIKLKESQKERLVIKTLRRKAQLGQPCLPERVHGKVIELEDEYSNVSRIIGSANFTGAAWQDTWNTETIFHERGRNSLPNLLGEHTEIRSVSTSELERWILDAPEKEDESGGELMCIYWAAIDESVSPPKLSISYAATTRPVRVRISAQFDPQRSELPSRAKELIELFENPQSWNGPDFSSNLVEMSLKVRSSVPEQLRVELQFAEGRILESAVEVTNPDFDLRDSDSGYPVDESAFENLFGGRNTIVPPLPKRDVLEVADEDIQSEDEEFTAPPMAPETLVDDPDFDRQPQGVRFAKLLSKLERTNDVQQLRILQKRVTAFREKLTDQSKKVVVEALYLKLKEIAK